MPSHPIPSGSLTSDPVPSDPLPSDPMSNDPMSNDPMPSDPMTGFSISSDSTPSGPSPSDPMAGDSLPIDSITSHPMSSGSLPNEPMATQPALSYPVAPGSVTPESVEPESLVSDSVPVSPSIANQISPPSLAKDPAPEDSPSNESLPSEPIPDPAASANIPFAEKASAADDFSDPSDNLAPADNPEVGPVSEEIAIPIAPPLENQEPAPAQAIDSQAIDLRQMADQPPPLLAPDLPALAEPSPPLQRQIPIATAAPLVAPAEPKATKPESATAAGSNSATALPLQLINQLLRKIGATPLVSLADMLPLLRILILAVLAGIALRLANATLGAIDDLPLVGGLLELVGLVTLLNFLARNAFKQKKRAELLARIQKLRTDLLG